MKGREEKNGERVPFPMCQTPSFLRRSLCKQEVMDWTHAHSLDGWMVDATFVGLSTDRVENLRSSTCTVTVGSAVFSVTLG